MQVGEESCPEKGCVGWVPWELDGGDITVKPCPECGTEFEELGVDWVIETVHLKRRPVSNLEAANHG